MTRRDPGTGLRLADGGLMPFSKTSRVVTSQQLIDLNRRATEFGATRVLDPYELLNLDMDGLHVLTHIFLFWHPFRRCEVALKIAGDPFPHFATLDLQDEWWDELPTLSDYLKAQRWHREHGRRGDGEAEEEAVE